MWCLKYNHSAESKNNVFDIRIIEQTIAPYEGMRKWKALKMRLILVLLVAHPVQDGCDQSQRQGDFNKLTQKYCFIVPR